MTVVPPTRGALDAFILYADDEVLVFNKPAGLVSQGARGGASSLDAQLADYAKASGRRPVLVHRLDRDTSGVILAARTRPAAGFLGKALMKKRFRKTYLALCGAAPPLGASRIDAPLRRDESGREAMMRICAPEHPDAEPAQTGYRVLEVGPDAALIEARPHTGRMHQIRAHLAHVGAPIVGDERYGGALTFQGAAAPRTLLHAYELTFPHPDGEMRTIRAPLPEDFLDALRRAGLSAPRALPA